MGSVIDWNDVQPQKPARSGGGGGGMSDKFLKLSQGEYQVRPVGKPYQFYAYYVADPKNPKKFYRAVTADPLNCVIRTNHNLEPKTRYAVNVIDRADGKLKIMEGPVSVFDKIKEWARVSKQDPGKNGGADFSIKVVVPANGDRKRTEYNTTPIVQTPFTAEEQEMLKKEGLHKLEEIYQSTPQNEIEAKLFPEMAQASAPAQQSTGSAPASAANDLGF